MQSTKRIEFFAEGVKLKAGGNYASGNHERAKRGAIKGWSSASRRRMREFMLCHRPNAETVAIGATLTIAGPSPDVAEVRDLWKNWCRAAQKRGWVIVWRLEVQQRGAAHWHCIMYVDIEQVTRGGKVPQRLGEELVKLDIQKSWEKALREMGPVEGITDPKRYRVMGRKVASVDHRMCFDGADKYATDLQVKPTACGSWMRYLQDHATKSKQEQIAEGFGRHWGKINAKKLDRVDAEEAMDMTDVQYAVFLRAYQRLCTPQLKDKRVEAKRCPFGRRLGRRIKRGTRGDSIWFSNPETVKKLALYAKAAKPENPAPEMDPQGALFIRRMPADRMARKGLTPIEINTGSEA